MNYFLVLNLFLQCFYTGKILIIRFLLTHPVYRLIGGCVCLYVCVCWAASQNNRG